MARALMIGKGKAVHASASIATSGMTECGKGTHDTVTPMPEGTVVTCKLCLRVLEVKVVAEILEDQAGTWEPVQVGPAPVGVVLVDMTEECDVLAVATDEPEPVITINSEYVPVRWDGFAIGIKLGKRDGTVTINLEKGDVAEAPGTTKYHFQAITRCEITYRLYADGGMEIISTDHTDRAQLIRQPLPALPYADEVLAVATDEPEPVFVGDESIASLARDLGTDPYTLREFAPDDLRDQADHERLPEPVAHVIRDAWTATDERAQTVPSAPTGTGWPGGMVSGRADYAKEPRRFRAAHGKRKGPRGCQARRTGR